MKKSTLVIIVLAIVAVAVAVIMLRRSRKAPAPITATGVAPTQPAQQAKPTQPAQPAQPAVPPSQAKPAPPKQPRAVEHRGSLENPASLNQQAPSVYWAKFATTKGNFVVQVTRSWSPHGADRFYNLVKNGFYNGDSFFRVLPGFIVQFGISPNPKISKVWRSANIPDDPVQQSNTAGTVTFATAGPGTRTTQVFINLNDNKSLDSQGFSPFGKVTQGMNVVQSFYSGYGEGAPMGSGPDQHLIQTEGEAYLAKDFPKLDHIKSAVVLQSNPGAASN